MRRIPLLCILSFFLLCKTNIIFSREPYWVSDFPIQVIMQDESIFYSISPRFGIMDRDPRRETDLIEYNMGDNLISFIKNANLPKSITSLTEDKESIFAGGDGLSVYNKTKKEWLKSKYNYLVSDIEINEGILWLGTDQGVKGIRLSDNEIIKQYSDKSGLNSDKVSSLFAIDNMLLVGTYKMNYPRHYDIYGLGLYKIDLGNNRIENIKPPFWGNKENPGLVLDMYKYKSKDVIKIVIWKDWGYKCYDYDYKTDKFAESTNQYHQIDRIIQNYGLDVHGDNVGKLIKLMLEKGYGSATEEAISIVYNRKDVKLFNEIVNNKNVGLRQRAFEYLSKNHATDIIDYFLNAIDDDDGYIRSISMNELVKRKDRRAVAPLRKMLLTKDHQKVHGALRGLIELEEPIVKEILANDDESLKWQLGGVYSIGGLSKDCLAEILMNRNEKTEIRREAIYYLNGGYGCTYYLSKKNPVVKFLKEALNDRTEDVEIRRQAAQVLKKIKN